MCSSIRALDAPSSTDSPFQIVAIMFHGRTLLFLRQRIWKLRSSCMQRLVVSENKLENLLLDFEGNLEVADFGLSALPQQGVGLIYTTCRTSNYPAP